MKRERIPYDVINTDENVDYSHGTSKLLGCTKGIVSIVLAMSIVVDIITLTMLAMGQDFGIHYMIPIIMIIVDVAFLAASIFVNFKFKYSNYIWIGYCAAAIVLPIASSFMSTIGGEVATIVSIAVNITVHVVSAAMVAAVVCAVRKKSNVKSAIVGIVAAVIVAASAIGAGVYYGNAGVWGQSSPRTVVYDEVGEGYVVKEILPGKSNVVVIPMAFNGKPIIAIESRVFVESGVTYFDIQGVDKLKLNNMDALEDLTQPINLTVDKNIINSYRDELFAYASSNAMEKLGFQHIIDGMRPNNLADNEVYVDFRYELNKMPSSTVINKLTPSLVCQKNATFDYKNINGVLKAMLTEGEYSDLAWAYKNTNKLSLSKASRQSLLSSPRLNEDKIFNVTFDDVYRMSIAGSNDRMFIPDESWLNNDGMGFVGKYFTESELASIYDSIPTRNGFSVGNYGNGGVIANEEILLKRLQSNASKEVILSQIWTMNIPSVQPLDTQKNEYVYGDKIDMLIQADRQDFDYHYRLFTPNGEAINVGENVDKLTVSDLALPQDSGNYRLRVYATNKKSALTSDFIDLDKNILISKKILEVVWDKPTGNVYDGQTRFVNCSINPSGIVNGDGVDVLHKQFSYLRANKYDFQTDLQFEWQDRYDISDTSKFTFTILPKDVMATWTVGDYVYSGSNYSPTATAKGLSNITLSISVSGAKRNAGKNYIAMAICNDTNYKITNNTQTFSIAQKEYTPQWGNTSLTYNGEAQTPSKMNGIGDINREAFDRLVISGAKTNAGSYTATASLPSDSNFYIASGNANVAYTIAQKEYIPQWGNTSLTYNGEAQTPSKMNGIGDINREAFDRLIISGAKTNAGSYTATASLPSDSNFYIASGNANVAYTIAQKEYIPQWGDTLFIYNGEAQMPSKIKGNGDINDEAFNQLTISGAQTNAGTYTATASLPSDSNFYITSGNASIPFTIAKKELTLTFKTTSFVYDGAYKFPTFNLSGQLDGEEEMLRNTMNYSGGAVNGGIHNITISLPGKANYYFNVAPSVKMNITARTLNVTIEDVDKVYDGKIYTGFKVNIAGLADTDHIDEVFTYVFSETATTATDIGSYTISIERTQGAKGSNYIVKVKAGKLTINAKTVNLTWTNNKQYIEGNSVIAPILNANVDIADGIISFKYYTAEGVLLDGKPTAIGNYTVEAVGNRNYALSNYSQTYSIVAAEVEDEV